MARTYFGFQTSDGLTLPYAVETTFNGKPVTNPAVTLSSNIVNDILDPKLFVKPD